MNMKFDFNQCILENICCYVVETIKTIQSILKILMNCSIVLGICMNKKLNLICLLDMII